MMVVASQIQDPVLECLSPPASTSEWAWCSAQGPRDNIEDVARVLVIGVGAERLVEISILLVCDGAGGQDHGEVASSSGAQVILSHLAAIFTGHCCSGSQLTADVVLSALREALTLANQTVLQLAAADSRLQGMASTVVCAVPSDDAFHIAWAGDSRAYLLSAGQLSRLTDDHTEVNRLLQLGAITQAEAPYHDAAHVIDRYLGQVQGFEVATRSIALTSGDLVMLCSDGLTDVVTDAEIAQWLGACQDGQLSAHAVPRLLVEQALSNCTSDNTTVVCYEHQPQRLPPQAFDRTMTGGYPTALANALTHIRRM